MIAYKIRFSDGTPGYQIMTPERVTTGLYTNAGAPLLKAGDYSVIDDGGNPTVGVTLPNWVGSDPPAPPAPVPQEVTPFQARMALLNYGMLDAVDAMMANAQTPRAAKIAWEYATSIHRQSAFIEALAPTLGLTDAQIDDLFKAASQIS